MFDKDVYQLGKELVELDLSMDNPVDEDIYLIEEMSELTKELMKARRGKCRCIDQELADVYVTFVTYCIGEGVDLNKIRDISLFKLKRGIERIKKGER